MPLQHGDRTLRRIPAYASRWSSTTSKSYAPPCRTLRCATFIVGYPGETEEEFQGLLDFVQAIEFDKVGAFTFSAEPGTPAAALPDQVPDAVKEERYARLMELQQPISLRKNQQQAGRRLEVLAEGVGEVAGSGAPLLLGRSYRDAPEVDGLVLIPGVEGLPAGEMLEVVITGALEYDLVGEPLIAETFSSTKETIALSAMPDGD